MQRYHSNAKLTVSGRRALLAAVERGETVTAACARLGVSRTTFHRWRRRFDAGGEAGLRDRSSAPRCPRMALDAGQLEAVRHLRESRDWGPDRIAIATGHARATVHRAIRRMGLSRARSPHPPAPRYERAGGATWSTSK